MIKNLTLKSKHRKIDNIELFESIDVNILDKLINSDLLNDNEWNEKQQLINYKKLIINGLAKVKYNRVDKIPFGRVNPYKSLGLHTIRRQIRHTLAKNTYVDIDIVNAHPVILYQICKEHNINCKYLKKYVSRRDEILKKVIDFYNVDKQIAKNLFIILLYFGSFSSWIEKNNIETQEEMKFIKKFKNEIKEIGQTIFNNNQQLFKLIDSKKKSNNETQYNKIGSVVSYFLQEIECEILETIYNYCIENEIIIDNNCVLCADGIMIKKEKYDDKLLIEFNKIVLKNTGFDVSFIKKEMNEDYLNILDNHILTEEQQEIKMLGNYKIIDCFTDIHFSIFKLNELFFNDIKELGEEKYIKLFHLTNSFKYFNKYHAEFYISNKIYKFEIGKIDSYYNFEDTFKHLYFIFEKNKYKFTKLYLESKYKNIYSTFNFEPNKKNIDDKYNLFTGFKYETNTKEYDEEVVRTFLNHIKYLSRDDEKVYNYIINWFSHLFQKPEKKTNVAIVLYSFVEGVGKNILLDIVSKLLTGYTGKFKDTKSLTDKFNGDLMGKLFIVGDEINAKMQDVANELKDIITRVKETIEFKGKDKLQDVSDYKNYIFTTNNENVFKISNSDRRFLFVDCPDETNSREYYNKIVEIYEDEIKLISIYNYLKTHDISTFNTRDIPITEYKKSLIFQNIPAYLKFIKTDIDIYSDSEFLASDLYKMSIEYAKKNKMNSSYTERFFYLNFKKVFGEYNKLNKNKLSIYIFPHNLNDIIDDLITKNYVEKI